MDFTNILKDAGVGMLTSPRNSNKADKQINLTKIELDYPLEKFDSNFYKLPQRLENYLSHILFAVPKETLNLVKHLLMESYQHINSPFYYSGYDNMMKESLKSIGYEILKQAIHLLADYTYDIKTKYYLRDVELTSPVVEALILYKFLAGKVDKHMQRTIAFSAWVFQENESENHASQYHIYAEVYNNEKIQDYVSSSNNSLIQTSLFKNLNEQKEIIKWDIFQVKIDSNIGEFTYTFAASSNEEKYVSRFVLNDFYKRYSQTLKTNEVLTVNDHETTLVVRAVADHFGILDIKDENAKQEKEKKKFNAKCDLEDVFGEYPFKTDNFIHTNDVDKNEFSKSQTNFDDIEVMDAQNFFKNKQHLLQVLEQIQGLDVNFTKIEEQTEKVKTQDLSKGR